MPSDVVFTMAAKCQAVVNRLSPLLLRENGQNYRT